MISAADLSASRLEGVMVSGQREFQDIRHGVVAALGVVAADADQQMARLCGNQPAWIVGI